MRRMCVLLLVALGCASSEPSLRVDVKTDLVPGAEFAALRIVIDDAGETTQVELPALFSYDFLDGFQAIETAVAANDVIVTGSLIDVFGEPVVSREASVQIDGDRTAVTLVFSRDCRDLVCPGALDPATATACVGGVCVDPRCSPERPEFCRSECDTAEDCDALAACSTPLCVSGTCLYSLDGVECSDDTRCDPDLGCVAVPADACFPGERCEWTFGPYCADTRSDPQNCGECREVCTAPTGSIPRCTAGECAFDCMPGLVRCGEGCETTCVAQVFESPTQQEFEVPSGCDLVLARVWGAGGGAGQRATLGSAGGYASGIIRTSAGEVLTIVVGAPGADGVDAISCSGGVPGGGSGGIATDEGGGGGGGYSGVFRGAVSAANAILIAGGGGGSGGGRDPTVAGAGGGTEGQACAALGGGQGGRQDGGGAGGGPMMDEDRRGDDGMSLQGGNGGNGADAGGGGGGGWFGGGGSTGADSDAHGGGGGSAYAASDVQAVTLTAGDLRVPALVTDAARGSAGEPGQPGRLIVQCISR